MSDEPTLFPLPVIEVEWPPWFTAGKNTPHIHCVNVSRGLHPFGGPLGPEESRCGQCAHVVGVQAAKTYWKCEKHKPWTSGLATDVRMRWRGCSLFEADE